MQRFPLQYSTPLVTQCLQIKLYCRLSPRRLQTQSRLTAYNIPTPKPDNGETVQLLPLSCCFFALWPVFFRRGQGLRGAIADRHTDSKAGRQHSSRVLGSCEVSAEGSGARVNPERLLIATRSSAVD